MGSVNTRPNRARAWQASPLVVTRQGLLQGYPGAEGTWVWKGVPYAKPPLGELRWRAPRAPEPWEGIRKASRFGKPSPQLVPFIGLPLGSEDCLYLNLWRPRTEETGLPVYVYLHGGGNTIGAASLPDYHGHGVAARSNMVFVSLNYRLGVLGWFRHPALAAGASAEDASGNFGTLDILAALRWIQDNIEAFGGDPGCVTLTGESAGAFNTLSLLLCPLASGLFHRAVAQSGIATVQDLEVAEAASSQVLEDLLHRQGQGLDAQVMGQGEVAAFLRSRKPRDLVGAVGPSPLGMGMADYPSIYGDSHVIPTEGFALLREGRHPNRVPLILGTTKDEWKLFMYAGKEFRRDPGRYETLAAYRSALWRHQGVDYLARSLAAQAGHPPVYAYRFDWGSPREDGTGPLPPRQGRRLGAFHTVEVSFFLGTGVNSGSILVGRPFTAANRPGREALSAAAMAYLAAFARRGDPNPPGAALPRWEAYDPQEGGFKALAMDVEGPAPRLSPLRHEAGLAEERAKAEALGVASADMGLIAAFREGGTRPA